MADGNIIVNLETVAAADRFLCLKDRGLGLEGPFQVSAEKVAASLGNVIALDTVRMGVESRSVTAPPSSPAEGARYIVPVGATGVWAGHANMIAVYSGDAWSYITPQQGYSAIVIDEWQIYAYNATSTSWIAITNASLVKATVAELTTLMATAPEGTRGEVAADVIATSVSRARASNVVTLALSGAHGLGVGAVVNVRGLGGSGYNGRFTMAAGTTGATLVYAATGADEATTADAAGQVDRNGVYSSNGAGGLVWVSNGAVAAQLTSEIVAAVDVEASARGAADAALKAQIDSLIAEFDQISVNSILATLPPGPVGVWLVEKYAATPQPHVPNLVKKSVPVPKNLLRGLDDDVLRPSFWGAGGATITYAQNGPSGSTKAVRVQAAAGSWYYKYNLSTIFPIGGYTVAFDYKRAGASDQTFKTAFGPSATQTFTATDSWQTANFHVTLASTSGELLLAQNVSGAAADILIDNIRLYAGSVDHGANHQNGGHMLLGKSINNGAHTVASGAIDLASGAGGLIVFDEDVDLSAATIIAIGSKNSAGNGSGYHAIVSKTTSYAQLTAYFERELIGVSKLNGGTYERKTLGYFETYVPGYHFWAHRISSESADFFFDDSHFQQGAGGSGASVRSLYVGGIVRYGDYVCNFKTAAIAIWPRALSNEEIATARTALMTRAANVGATSGVANDRFLFVEGDSLSFNGPGDAPSLTLGSYWYRFAANQSPKNMGWLGAIGGSSIETLLARKQVVLDAIPSAVGTRKVIFSSWVGVNGLVSHVGGVSGWLADYAGYLDEIRAKGAKVVVLTITPYSLARGGATFDPLRLAANDAIRGWVGTHCDAIVDIGGHATLGVAAAAENTTYYYDGLHMTDAAYAILEPMYRTVINAI